MWLECRAILSTVQLVWGYNGVIALPITHAQKQARQRRGCTAVGDGGAGRRGGRSENTPKCAQSLEGDTSRRACTFSLARCVARCAATRQIGALRGLRVGALSLYSCKLPTFPVHRTSKRLYLKKLFVRGLGGGGSVNVCGVTSPRPPASRPTQHPFRRISRERCGHARRPHGSRGVGRAADGGAAISAPVPQPHERRQSSCQWVWCRSRRLKECGLEGAVGQAAGRPRRRVDRASQGTVWKVRRQWQRLPQPRRGGQGYPGRAEEPGALCVEAGGHARVPGGAPRKRQGRRARGRLRRAQ